MTSGSNGLIKFCPVCGKWPIFGLFLPYGPEVDASNFALCNCGMTQIGGTTYKTAAREWNLRVDRLLSEKDGTIADKEDTDGVD